MPFDIRVACFDQLIGMKLRGPAESGVDRGFQRFAGGRHEDLHWDSFPPSNSSSRFRISSSWPRRASAYFFSPRSVSFPRPNPRFFPRPSPNPRPCRLPAGTSALRAPLPSHFPRPLPVPDPFPCGPVPSPLGMFFLLSPSRPPRNRLRRPRQPGRRGSPGITPSALFPAIENPTNPP